MRSIDRSPSSIRAVAGAALLTLSAWASGCASLTSTSAATQAVPRGAYAMVDGKVTPVPAIPMGDTRTVNRIIREGQRNNQTVAHLTELCETFGARLTGSTSCEQSSQWARTKLSSWGLNQARLDWWGDVAVRFDRGPSTGAAIIATSDDPDSVVRQLQFTTLAWTRGTAGPLRGPVVPMPTSESELGALGDRLTGAWVLIPPDYADATNRRRSGQLMRQRLEERQEIRVGAKPKPVVADSTQPQADPNTIHWAGSFSYGDSKLPLTLTLIKDDAGALSGTQSIQGFHSGPITDTVYDDATATLRYAWKHSMGKSNFELLRAGDQMTGVSISTTGERYPIEMRIAPPEAPADTQDQGERTLLARVLALSPAGFISSSLDERVWTTSATGWRERAAHDYAQDIEVNVRQSDYDFLNSRVADGARLEVEFNLAHAITEGPVPCYNVIAEITGSELPHEVVIVSAHLDSWDGPGSQGAIDNGTGVSVVMEAARILATVGVRPKRTIRFILWTGEEQGLLGSRAYVAGLSQDQLDTISAVFVDDGGTNFQGGIPAADHMVDYLAAASAPVNGHFFSEHDAQAALTDEDPDNDFLAGYMNVNIRPTGGAINTHGGSDHAPFNAVGVPGFFWDETGRANYRAAWHTQRDRLDQAIGEYLTQSSTNMAVVAYNLAMAPDLLPRTPADGSGLATVETAAPAHE